MREIVTVREAVARAKADGLPVSEYALRGWIKAGEVPSRKAGNKILLYYPNLIKYLQCANSDDYTA
ncbi:MAG: hypothetical protein IKU20_02585 [Lachnospiraceae bacterium]|nr:hypothetical protein [Lachnospiraceae bacterium]